MELWYVWLIVAVVLVIAEIFTSMVIALCIAVGAVGGMVAALCGSSLETQLLVMACTMLVAFASIPRMLRRFKLDASTAGEVPSNMDALVGRSATVYFSDHDAGRPRVKIDGDSWLVRSRSGESLQEGMPVKVIGYDSIVLIVGCDDALNTTN